MAVFTNITATGSAFADAAPITRNGKNMIVLVASSGASPPPGVIMPSSALKGDYVEFHADPTSIGQYIVYNEVGDAITGGSHDSAFRKIETTSDHTTWAPVL